MRRYGHHQSTNGHSRYNEHSHDRGKLFRNIHILYGLMGLQFSEEAAPMGENPEVLDYYLFSFTADFGKIIRDYIAEAS